MTAKPSPAVLEAWAALLLTERALVDRVEEDLKRAGLPPLEWYHVLHEVDRSGSGVLRQNNLQKQTHMAQYNVCRLVDRLEREELVERRPCKLDARHNVVVITDKGKELRNAMGPIYAAAVEEHFGARLTPAEAQQLSGLLAKLMSS